MHESGCLPVAADLEEGKSWERISRQNLPGLRRDAGGDVVVQIRYRRL